MNIFDLLESPGMGRPHDTKGIQSAADQSAASPIGSGTTKHEAKKKPVTMMGKNVKESVQEAEVKSNFKMPPESLQDKMYRQHQELRKQRGAPSPEEYKERIAQKQAEIDALKEGILDRGVPKMPKPRNPANAVLSNKVNAAGKHLDKKRRQELNPKHKHQDPLEEGWKDAVAGAALAGSIALGGMAHAGEPVVGQGQSQNMQMAVDMAKMNAKMKYMKTIHGDNFQDKQMPEYHWGKVDLKPGKDGGYQATVPLIVDNEVQESTGQLNWTVHFDDGTSQQVTVPSDEFDVRGYFAKRGKKVVEIDYSFAARDRQDAPRRGIDDPAAGADSLAKAQAAYDRGMTEQENVSESRAVKITDYDTWSDEVKALGGEIHPQKDRNLLVAQSWDGEEIGKFHLGKSMGFINQSSDLDETIRKMGSQYRLLSKKGKNLGTFDTKAGAEKHEREVQYFKHKNMEEGVEDSQEQHVAAMLNRRSRGLQVATHRTLFDLSDEHNSLPAGSTVRRVEGSKKLYVHLVDGSPKNVYRIDKNHVEPLDRTDEGWKGKLAGAALAGAAAIGGGDVDAQHIDLPGPQAVMIAHIVADVNGREVNKTVNLGTQYQSKEQAEQDLEEYMQSKGITRYSIRVEQSYEQPGTGYSQGRRTSGYATGGYSATGPIRAPGLGDMIAGKVSREIRAGIPDRGGYATGGTNQGQRPRDGSQWWKDQLPRMREDDNGISKDDETQFHAKLDKLVHNTFGKRKSEQDMNEDIERQLFLMSRAGYDIVQEAWSDKYKRSINCSNPKGFSQKAHCAGKKKNEAVEEQASVCTECGGAAYSDSVLAEKKDACYSKVKSRYKVWPSAYASGALVRCRKVGAANWGNKSKK